MTPDKLPMGTKLEIKSMHLEIDRNGQPRLIVVDQHKVEWVLSESNSGYGFITEFQKRENCWYFQNPS